MTDEQLFELLVKYQAEGEFRNQLIQPGSFYNKETGCRCPMTHILIEESLLDINDMPNEDDINEMLPPLSNRFGNAYDQFGFVSVGINAYATAMNERDNAK